MAYYDSNDTRPVRGLKEEGRPPKVMRKGRELASDEAVLYLLLWCQGKVTHKKGGVAAHRASLCDLISTTDVR